MTKGPSEEDHSTVSLGETRRTDGVYLKLTSPFAAVVTWIVIIEAAMILLKI
jgi:hypothetical protein